jgi:hypothetical protein
MRSEAQAIAEAIPALRTAQNRILRQLGADAPSLSDLREMHDAANSYRQLYSDLEMRLPDPGPTENPLFYRVKLIRPLLRHSPDWRHAELDRLARVGQLAGVERAIVADARRVANDKRIGSFIRPGALRVIRRSNITTYHGDPLAWMNQFASPTIAKVVAIGPGHGLGIRRAG